MSNESITQGPAGHSAVIARLAVFVQLISGLGVVAAITAPMLMRHQMQAKFGSFELGEELARMIVAQIRSAYPGLAAGFLLSVAGIIVGVGLWRRREWARRGWLVICVAWMVFALSIAVLAPDRFSLIPIVFRLVVLVASFRLLTNTGVRRQFAA